MLLCPVSGTRAAAQSPDAPVTLWKPGDAGNWGDALRWSRGVPDAGLMAIIGGTSQASICHGQWICGALDIGGKAGDKSSLTIAGGSLTVRDASLKLGHWPGAAGELILESGTLECIPGLAIGYGKTEPGLLNQGILRIRGGSFAASYLTLAGFGGTISIEGSKASSIYLVDFLRTNVTGAYIKAASSCIFSFTLDAHGVTPIVIGSKLDPHPLILRVAGVESPSTLDLKLSAVPPRDDVTLVELNRPAEGTFQDLPEGSEVSAGYYGKTYRWNVTYKGGKSGCDLVLIHPRGFDDHSPVTSCRPLPEVPKLAWQEAPERVEPPPPPNVPAFPGAEGFGAGASGGRGGKVVYVENLNDSGPGSLRAAVMMKGPRTVLFHVGGVIHLASPLVITEPYLTITGQTAPGDGIELRNGGIILRETHDIVLRHLRVRPGEGDNGGLYSCGIWLDNTSRSIVDHCSVSWATAQDLSVTGLSDLITVQWCFITEPLLNTKDLAYGSIIGGERISWHHNLYAHARMRIPLFQGNVQADFRNNVIYDWPERTVIGSFATLNYVGNFLKPGPSTMKSGLQGLLPASLQGIVSPATFAKKALRFYNDGATSRQKSVYMNGNILAGDAEASSDNWSAVTWPSSTDAHIPFPAALVATDTAQAAYDRVLKQAGATLPRRDAVDRRIVGEVLQSSGRILKVVADAGGYPAFQGGPLPIDQAGDTNLEK